MIHSFKNDYSEIAHPLILQTLLDKSLVQYSGYGEDEATKRLENLMKTKTSHDVSICLLSGGTQANLVVISKVLKTYEAVICCDSGHINVHETGAVEQTGHKIIPVKNHLGKIEIMDLKKVLSEHLDFHMVKPKMVYISNPTEYGTVYTKNELKELYSFCNKNDLFLFIDGARIATCLSDELSLKDITKYSDVYYFGGTKIGLPYGEMIVIKNKEIKESFKYHLKTKGAMLAKTYALSEMFLTLLENDFYKELASNAIATKSYLEQSLKELGFEILYVNTTNQLFVSMKNDLIKKLQKEFDFEVWIKKDDISVIRLVTSWATRIDDCKKFIDYLKLVNNLK